MELVFRRRVNLGKSLGLNVSKSGVSSSQRTRFGSFDTRGYSIRTGIPGMYYRGNWKKSGGLVFLIIPILLLVIVIIWILD